MSWKDTGYLTSRLEWLMITVGLLGIPHFEDIAGLVGALLCTPNCIVFPCACYLRFQWLGMRPRLQTDGSGSGSAPNIGCVSAYAVTIVLLIAGAIVTVMGSIANILKIASGG